MKIQNLGPVFAVTLCIAQSILQTAFISNSSASHLNTPGRLPTHLSPTEVTREALDEKAYPHFVPFLKNIDVSHNIQPTDPRNAHLIRTKYVFIPTPQMWEQFFQAAADDHITSLRAFALLSREIKKAGVVVFGPGGDFENAVKKLHIDLGLALPAHNIGTAIWSPDPSQTDPEFQLHMKVFYTEPFVHQFPDNILPANLKVGYGPEETYWLDGKSYRQHTVDTDIYYGPGKGVGFRNVRGIGGQKRGLMGFMQKVLFFLPDAVDSMTIDEARGRMVTEALVNTEVKEFEKNPLYSIKVQNP